MKKLGFLFLAVIIAIPAALFAEDEMSLNIPEASATAVAEPVAADTESNAGWQAFRLTLDVDFTTLNMKQANDAMQDDDYVTNFGVGFIGNLDLGIAAYPFLLLGPRVGYLYCLPASFENTLAGPLHTKTVRDASFIPVELGARLRFGIPGTTIALSTAAYAGVGFARVADNVDVTNGLSQEASYVQEFGGFGFSCEWEIAAEIKLMKGVDLNINGGYRLGGVMSVKQTQDVYYSFVEAGPTTQVGNKDDTLQNTSSTDVPFDYSGLNVGVGISLGF